MLHSLSTSLRRITCRVCSSTLLGKYTSPTLISQKHTGNPEDETMFPKQTEDFANSVKVERGAPKHNPMISLSERHEFKRMMEAKLEFIDDDSSSFTGLSDGDILIPSLDTHEALIGGVPYKELPIAFVKSTPNNTIVGIFDYRGKIRFAHASAGIEGHRNAKKSTNVAAQATGYSAANRARRKGVRNVRVIVKGLGAGRLPAIEGLRNAGLNIISLTDNTPIFTNGPKPRKQRKL